MSGAETMRHKAKLFVEALPGRRESRGGTIPDDIWHTIMESARGTTLPLWGRHPTPQQIQDLHDMGAHTPQAVHDAFSQLPHPGAPSIKVGEYSHYEQAYRQYAKSR